jgi:ribosome-associated protein
VEAGRLLQDRHCEDVLLLDVTGLSQVCDYVLIATGTSDRQMKSVSDEVADLGEEMKFPAFRKNIDTGATWIVVDFITVVLHLFEPQRRAYYDLEDLWSDAKHIEVPTGSAAT